MTFDAFVDQKRGVEAPALQSDYPSYKIDKRLVYSLIQSTFVDRFKFFRKRNCVPQIYRSLPILFSKMLELADPCTHLLSVGLAPYGCEFLLQ